MMMVSLSSLSSSSSSSSSSLSLLLFQRRSDRIIICSVMTFIMMMMMMTTTTTIFMTKTYIPTVCAFTLQPLRYSSKLLHPTLQRQHHHHHQQQQHPMILLFHHQTPRQPQQYDESNTSFLDTATTTTPSSESRRHVLNQIVVQLPILPLLLSTTTASATTTTSTTTTTTTSTSANQVDDEVVVLGLLKQQIHDAFAKIRYELESKEDGGMYILQQYIQNEDYDAILEFTKTYDLKLRKGMIKPASKLLIKALEVMENPKSSDTTGTTTVANSKATTIQYIQSQTTTIGNAITFDLIGINRNVRPSKNQIIQLDQIQKYYNELQNDIQSFLQLEDKYLPTIS